MISKICYKICCDNLSQVENFEKAINDHDEIWHLHHRLETHDENGNKRSRNIPMKVLKEKNLYYNRPASELIFLTNEEHSSLHRKGFIYTNEEKKQMSERMKKYVDEHPEFKENISKSLKGRKYSEEEYAAHQQQYENMRNDPKRKELGRQLGESNKGKINSEEYKKAMSESCKKVVHTQEWINNAANAKRGMKYDTTNMKWFTNGVINYRGAECPEGFRPGKVNKSKPGGLDYHWYTNGKENVRAKECPQGFWKGRTISKA